jgi:hypothetical protein
MVANICMIYSTRGDYGTMLDNLSVFFKDPPKKSEHSEYEEKFVKLVIESFKGAKGG